MKFEYTRRLLLVGALALALSACGSKVAPPQTGVAVGAGTSGAQGGNTPTVSTPAGPSQSTTGGTQPTVSTGAAVSQPGSQSSNSTPGGTTGSGEATSCLIAVPDAAPVGFTETGRSLVQGKGGSWTLSDGTNTYQVSLVFKADAAAADKELELQRTLFKPYMTPVTFNGCQALTKQATDNTNKVIKVTYTHDNEVVFLTVTGPSPSMDKLQALGRGGAKR